MTKKARKVTFDIDSTLHSGDLSAYTMAEAIDVLTSDKVKTAAMAAGLGLVGSTVVTLALSLWKPPSGADLNQGLYERSTFSRVKGGIVLATGAVAGSYAYDVSEEAGVALWASLGGLGLVMMLAPTALFV